MKIEEVVRIMEGIKQECISMFIDNNKVCKACDMAILALKNREQERWHSVAKEGNPKKSEFYLWTSKDGTVREDFYQVTDDIWSKAWQFGYKVVAWKNEPEPYTEEE